MSAPPPCTVHSALRPGHVLAVRRECRSARAPAGPARYTYNVQGHCALTDRAQPQRSGAPRGRTAKFNFRSTGGHGMLICESSFDLFTYHICVYLNFFVRRVPTRNGNATHPRPCMALAERPRHETRAAPAGARAARPDLISNLGKSTELTEGNGKTLTGYAMA